MPTLRGLAAFRRARTLLVPLAFATVLVGPAHAEPRDIVGDCNGDGCVRVNELCTALAVELGVRNGDDCPAIGCNGSPHSGPWVEVDVCRSPFATR